MSQERAIKVVLVDDHAVVRTGLATYLATCDDIVLVGEARNGEQALLICEQTRPDVVLMDLVLFHSTHLDFYN